MRMVLQARMYSLRCGVTGTYTGQMPGVWRYRHVCTEWFPLSLLYRCNSKGVRSSKEGGESMGRVGGRRIVPIRFGRPQSEGPRPRKSRVSAM